jgi:mRNA deadenylase 3'-5' endonuclease subunit Ccr4
VQADAYHSFFQPLLLEKGFDGLYKSKTRESMGLVGKVNYASSSFFLCYRCYARGDSAMQFRPPA